jgi:MFS family permease
VPLNRSLVFLCLGRGLRSFGQGYLNVVVPLYLLARGASVAEAGILITVWALGAGLLGLVAGFVADRYGRRRVLLAFGVLWCFCALAFYFNLPFWMLAVAGALGTIGRGGGPASGGAFGPFYSSEQALIAEHASQANRTKTFAIFSMTGAIGGALGLLLTGFPPRLLFALTSLVAVLLVASTLPVEESLRGAPQAPRRRVIALAPATKNIVGRFWITNSINGLAVGFLGPMLVLWFHLRYGATSHDVGTIYFVIALASAVSYLFVSRIVRKIGGAVKTIVALRVCAVALLVVMPLMPGLWLAGVVYLARMVLNSITMPVRQSYVMGIVPRHERSRVASLSNLPSQFFSMVGPSIAGVLLTQTWIGSMLEAAAVLQLVNAYAYWKLFGRVVPPEETAA